MDEADLGLVWRLAAALGIGLLIGLERGWHLRDEAEGSRTAGIRTFALIGLAGGVCAALEAPAGAWLLPALLLALGGLFAFANRHTSDRGLTTEMAAILTLLLGAAAGYGESGVAAVVAVVAALLLGVKRPLHRMLQRLDQRELFAVLQLLAISLVLLPLLPDRGFGPWDALNPHKIWWMVVLVAGLSSAGYFASRLLGPGGGLLATALLGGLASSTATTVALARRVRSEPQAAGLGAAAALAAGCVVAPRLMLLVAVIAPVLLERLAWPLAAGAAAALLLAALLWFRLRKSADETEIPLGNPFELGPALKFGLILAAVMLLAEALPRWLGEGGLYALAAVSGLTDVDAITLALGGDVTRGVVAPEVGAGAILLAVAVNNMVKAGIGFVLGGAAFGWRLLAGYLLFTGVAAAVLLLVL